MAKPILALHLTLNQFRRVLESKEGTNGYIDQLKENFNYEYHIILIPNEIIEETRIEIHSVNESDSNIEDLEERLTTLINGAKELIPYGK